MNIKDHTTPEKLERYAFLWSEARLVIAAIALLIGGIPPIMKIPLPMSMFPLTWNGLHLAWLITGAASAYLLYMWNKEGRKLFGKEDKHDKIAFLFSIVTGFNLGITGLLGTNIGMSIVSNKMIYALAGVVYLLVAAYLWKRWKEMGEQLFK